MTEGKYLVENWQISLHLGDLRLCYDRMTTRSQSEADKVAAAGFAEVYQPVKPYLDALDVFLQAQVDDLEPGAGACTLCVWTQWQAASDAGGLQRLVGWRRRAQCPAHQAGFGDRLVHLATLVHDDILDEADTRHRQETAAKKFGPAAAVLIGDVLFSHALKLAAEFDTTEVCRSVAHATARVCAGEIAQTYQRGEVNYSRAFYYRVIQLKTAELFEVACRLGARVAGYPEAFSEAAGLFGRHVGIAYQIFDDLVDLYADESMIGKTLGTDVEKGKFTLPLLLLLEKLPEAERDSLLDRFRQGDRSVAADFTRRLHDFPILRRWWPALKTSSPKRPLRLRLTQTYHQWLHYNRLPDWYAPSWAALRASWWSAADKCVRPSSPGSAVR